MSQILNVTRSRENAALLVISMNRNDQSSDQDDFREIYACQSGHTLISIKLKNFSKPIETGSLIFARGSLSEAMNRTKLVVDLNQESHRWVVMDGKRFERKTEWIAMDDLTIHELSDMKNSLTQVDVGNLDLMQFKKHARCFQIVQYELTKENRINLAHEKPNYIKGEAYEKLFEIFKVSLFIQNVFIYSFRMRMEFDQLQTKWSLRCQMTVKGRTKTKTE